MHTYAKLQDGRKMIIYIENSKEETMGLYPIDGDPKVDGVETVPYDQIVNIDTNLAIL
jgi:hypothetical protein